MESNQETFEAEIINDDFSPLDAPVKQRSYTQHKIDDTLLSEELEEPNYERPSFADLDGTAEEEAKEPERPFNPSYNELDNKEKKMGAEMMADMTLDIYEKGCFYMGKIPEISEAKLDTLIAEGEIDGDIQLQTENGDVPIKVFANEYNESIKEAFEVSDEFKEKVRPPLVRVFQKRGIGMTDEQLLAYYFVTDLGTKGAQAFMLRKTANSILDNLKDNTRAMREANQQRYQTTPNPAPTPAPAPAPAPQPAQQYQPETFVDYEETYVKPQPVKREPKTNLEEQLTYFEPEEQNTVYSNLKGDGGFTDDFKDVDGMPKFGDKKILSELERISKQSENQEKPKRTTATRKPRNNPRK